MREFDLIARIAARAGCAPPSPGNAVNGRRDDIVLGMGDDAALLAPTPGMQLVVATDTLVRGVHYPPGTSPADIGWKALAVNLSDLAAMGAVPRWALLQLTLADVQEAWLDGFLDGWCALAHSSGIALVGGDTSRGPEAIGVTVLGEVPSGAALLRSGAVAGDRVWVSGTLGDAAAALQAWRAAIGAPRAHAMDGHAAGAPEAHPMDVDAAGAPKAHRMDAHATGAPEAHPMGDADDHRVRLGRTLGDAACLNRPEPRLALGRALRGIASACIDLSDGLLADLGHIATASGTAAELLLSELPTSGALATLAPPERWPLQLAGGDDYELCFTAPVSRDAQVRALASGCGIALTPVGRIVVGSGVRVLHADGSAYTPPRQGYQHFA